MVASRIGLSSSIYTCDVNRAFQAMRDIEAGNAALDVFTEWKTVYVNFSGRLQRAQIDNR